VRRPEISVSSFFLMYASTADAIGSEICCSPQKGQKSPPSTSGFPQIAQTFVRLFSMQANCTSPVELSCYAAFVRQLTLVQSVLPYGGESRFAQGLIGPRPGCLEMTIRGGCGRFRPGSARGRRSCTLTYNAQTVEWAAAPINFRGSGTRNALSSADQPGTNFARIADAMPTFRY
jgi:hypothetical protein